MNTGLPLRDIHLPDAVGWWPPAPGWWLLGVVLIGLFVGIFWWLRQRRQRTRVYRSARVELGNIKQRFQQQQDATAFVRELSVLLRRVAITVSPRKQAAGLTGEQWLSYLDRLADAQLFATDTGRQLLNAPYRQASDIDADRLLIVCEQWLGRLGQQAGQSHA